MSNVIAADRDVALSPVTPAAPKLTRRVLIVEDNETAGKNLQKILQQQLGVDVTTALNGQQAMEVLERSSHSLVITDLRMPEMDGLELLRGIQKRALPVTVIVTTGHGSINEAVEAMRLGAYDFLTKPIDVNHLGLVIARALRERSLQDEVAMLREQLQTQFSFQNILSKNPRMHAVFELIKHVANANTTVLIEGETGTGKEQVARAIHESSAHPASPFIAVNCAALPETLLESELFGHEKGAFTGATNQRRGRFEMAQNGTIFLDEVGDVPPAMQAKLLRVLQERAFERLGGTETINVDVRVIAATNRSLQKLVRDGIFREDLFYRLNVVKIDLPPLRERPEDIPVLALHFTNKYMQPHQAPKSIDPAAMEILLNYSWPGNIRELENAIERACVTSASPNIRPENLPPELSSPVKPKSRFAIDLQRPLADHIRQAVSQIESEYLRKALRKTRGHVGRCARICGLSRRSITTKIAEYELDKSEFKKD